MQPDSRGCRQPIMLFKFFIVNEILAAQIVLLVVAVGVTVHLARVPTYRKTQ